MNGSILPSLDRAGDPIQVALVARGFKQVGSDVFRASSGITITRRRLGSEWWRLESSDILLPRVARSVPCSESLAPRGPFKLVPAPSCARLPAVRVVADVPARWAPPLTVGSSSIVEGADSLGTDPLACWASDLRRELDRLTGRRPPKGPLPATAHPAPDMERRLSELGWTCARGGASGKDLHVNFQGEGYFKQVLVRPVAGEAISLEMHLADIQGWSPVCQAAALKVAIAANELLRLARIVRREEQEGARVSWIAQVHLGRLPANSGWLHLAVDSLRATAVVIATELPALEDEALAAWIVESSVRQDHQRSSTDPDRAGSGS